MRDSLAEVAAPPSPLCPSSPSCPGHGVDVVGRHGLAPLGPDGGRHLLDPVVVDVGDVEVTEASKADAAGPDSMAEVAAPPSPVPEAPVELPAMV